MSFKSGMVAARKQGLSISSVQLGPRGGQFYFRNGHKVYGAPPVAGTPRTREEYAHRPHRESLSKQLGKRRSAAIRKRDGDRCVYCKMTAATSGHPLHLDHIIPKAHGGMADPANLVSACHHCNSARKDMTITQWAAMSRGRFTAAQIVAHARQPLDLS